MGYSYHKVRIRKETETVYLTSRFLSVGEPDCKAHPSNMTRDLQQMQTAAANEGMLKDPGMPLGFPCWEILHIMSISSARITSWCIPDLFMLTLLGLELSRMHMSISFWSSAMVVLCAGFLCVKFNSIPLYFNFSMDWIALCLVKFIGHF